MFVNVEITSMAWHSVFELELGVQIVQHMPSSGEFPPFKWKDYSPYIFHCLRETFGIDNRDYLISITNRKYAL